MSNVFKNSRRTERGFCYKEFIDRYGCKCSLQESSLVDPSIWLGPDETQSDEFKAEFKSQPYTRMHLSYKQVQELVEDLQSWLNKYSDIATDEDIEEEEDE